jgi:hypothetical protein
VDFYDQRGTSTISCSENIFRTKLDWHLTKTPSTQRLGRYLYKEFKNPYVLYLVLVCNWFRLLIHRHPYMERLLPTVEVTYLQFSTSPVSKSNKFWTDIDLNSNRNIIPRNNCNRDINSFETLNNDYVNKQSKFSTMTMSNSRVITFFLVWDQVHRD